MSNQLTKRQLEVVCYLANGHRMEEIAQLAHLSVPSLEKTLRRAKDRMEARTNPHLVSLCIASGQIQWNPEDEVRYINQMENN